MVVAPKRQVPLCGKCGERHYNIIPCASAAVEMEQVEAKRRAKFSGPHVVRQEREDGLREWTSRVSAGRQTPIGNGRVVHDLIDRMPRLPKPRPALTYPRAVEENSDG